MTVHHCARGHHGGDDAACQCISYSDLLNYIVARGRWCTATHRNLERRPGLLGRYMQARWSSFANVQWCIVNDADGLVSTSFVDKVRHSTGVALADCFDGSRGTRTALESHSLAVVAWTRTCLCSCRLSGNKSDKWSACGPLPTRDPACHRAPPLSMPNAVLLNSCMLCPSCGLPCPSTHGPWYTPWHITMAARCTRSLYVPNGRCSDWDWDACEREVGDPDNLASNAEW
jgi:hypothetical protein